MRLYGWIVLGLLLRGAGLRADDAHAGGRPDHPAPEDPDLRPVVPVKAKSGVTIGVVYVPARTRSR